MRAAGAGLDWPKPSEFNLGKLGLRREDRSFSAQITIGRVKMSRFPRETCRGDRRGGARTWAGSMSQEKSP